jgi:type IV fimbrial biogenesis protein FimT
VSRRRPPRETPSPHRSRRRPRWLRALARGFTLAEILIVLALIALLVVVASPTFVKLLRDRRVSRLASQIVDYMRTARTMAIGRGQPILFSWNSAGKMAASFPGGTGFIEINEPLVTKNTAATTCSTTAWRTATTQQTASFDLQSGKFEYAAATLFDDVKANNTIAGADICFTPTGRMYIRTGPAGNVTGAFAPVMGVPYFSVVNTDSNAVRTVYLLPNGTARMQL